jgi:hypothetical protein
MLELFLFAGFFAQFDFADQNQHLWALNVELLAQKMMWLK